MKKKQLKTVKTTLTKSERKKIEERIAQLKRKKVSVQTSIPYIEMFRDGICLVKENYYTRTVRFYDTDYQLVSKDSAAKIFDDYCRILNYFDDTVSFQLTFENQTIETEELIKQIEIPENNDEFDDIRSEYSEMLKRQLVEGNNGKTMVKFLTFGVEADTYKKAKSRLDGIGTEIVNEFKKMGVAANVVNAKDRLHILHKSLNPLNDNEFLFDWNYRVATGASTKDFIAPSSMKFAKNMFEVGNAYGQVSVIQIFAGELSDRILNDFLDSDDFFCLNIHAKPYEQSAALKFLRLKLTAIEANKIDEQKRAARGGYDMDILPQKIPMYIEEIKSMIEDLNSRNERLFTVTITIRSYAESKKQLKLQTERLKRIANKNNCRLITLDYQQESALGSSLILGNNSIEITRILTTSSTGIFVPFTTRELFQSSGVYYGLNALSRNMIMGDRKRLKNPNGLFLGTPGSGKSMSVKREITDVYLRTKKDDIFICDPEAEYAPLVNKFKGQVIKISSSSEQHINPMDIVWDSPEGDPIGDKSNFLISLCEIIVGGEYGLEARERSIIDRCVRKIYMDAKGTGEMPLLQDLYEELRMAGEEAERVASSLEMYVTGSHNVFNNYTNIDLNNRLISFDIKSLGTQLKSVGMLIIQEMVWNRVALNRDKFKSTRYYMDEFHLLLKSPQTARYSAEIWKRFRKWGGIPTGITQNVKDLLSSIEIESIFDNSDFIYLLNQAPGDRDILAEKLHISDEQLKYIENADTGSGLIIFNDIRLPFKDNIPSDTLMYKLMTTKLSDLEEQVQPA